MKPETVAATLKKRLEGKIISNISWPGTDARQLAPLCGRLVESVAYVNSTTNRVIVALEAPEFDDELPGLAIDPGAIVKVSGKRSMMHTTALLLSDGTEVVVSCAPKRGRDAYDNARPSRSDYSGDTEMLKCLAWAINHNRGRIGAPDIARLLGIDTEKAKRVAFRWTGRRVLDGQGNNKPRVVSDAGRALVLSALEGTA